MLLMLLRQRSLLMVTPCRAELNNINVSVCLSQMSAVMGEQALVSGKSIQLAAMCSIGGASAIRLTATIHRCFLLYQQ